ncbi:MAG: inhibitor of KinA [Verrucomicrobiota bacterium]|jgi:inhibitor of KinA
MEISALGDCAVVLRVVENSAEDADKALEAVLKTRQQIETAQIPGVIEVAPAYTTVAVFFDPLRAGAAGAFIEKIRAALKTKWRRTRSASPREIEIPVCYDREFALDLDHVAQTANLNSDEIARRHAEASYRVSCVGFMPGFPYLSGLPRELATPRRDTPRTKIPAGSVAIGGAQTGIYPFESPGGWNVIGRTPQRLFDAQRTEPALLRAGDRVRFRPVTRAEFDNWRE